MPNEPSSGLRVNVQLTSYQTNRAQTMALPVDPSTLYTWIPREVAEQVGIEPRDVWRFRAEGGAVLERRVGDVRIEVEGREGPTVVVFAERGDRLVLGDLALTCVGLEVDPATGSLREKPYFLALAA